MLSWSVRLLLLLTVVALKQARTAVKTCPAGEKLHSTWRIRRGNSDSFVLFPRCKPLQADICTTDCRWLQSCRLHDGWQDGDGGRVYVAGMSVAGRENVFVYCCISFMNNIGECSWLPSQRTRRVASLVDLSTDDSLIVRDVVTDATVNRPDSEQLQAQGRPYRVETCTVVAERDTCDPSNMTQPEREAFNRVLLVYNRGHAKIKMDKITKTKRLLDLQQELFTEVMNNAFHSGQFSFYGSKRKHGLQYDSDTLSTTSRPASDDERSSAGNDIDETSAAAKSVENSDDNKSDASEKSDDNKSDGSAKSMEGYYDYDNEYSGETTTTAPSNELEESTTETSATTSETTTSTTTTTATTTTTTTTTTGSTETETETTKSTTTSSTFTTTISKTTEKAPQCPKPDWSSCVSDEEANERFAACCRSKDAPAGCMDLCNYEAGKQQILQNAITNKCPVRLIGVLMECASEDHDATECCEAQGLLEGRQSVCRPFCHPSASDVIVADMKYLPCLDQLQPLSQCFKAYLN